MRHGARPNFLHLYGFPATACISVNDTVIHGIPSRDQKIRPGAGLDRPSIFHGVGKELHEDPEIPNYGHAGRGQRLMPGMCIAIEPMICQYKCAVKTLKDGWTVKTCDGGLAAHFEHTVAITSNGPEVLTHGWEEPGWTL